ncbi:MAG: cytochrome c [Gemmatimonadota bacterium]|nr:cytochrome c [Gemmatimonadota bacterium]
MKNGLIVGGLAVMALGTTVHQASAQSAAGKTIWDGVYTTAQAERGKAVASQTCAGCHSPEEWAEPGFMGGWVGEHIGGLHSRLRLTMPANNPGFLTTQQYADIVAYMLSLNRAPAGTTELPATDEGLRAIAVTKRAGR